ncbi:MAG: hypothetical protein K8T89_10990 [Planctomycetes bacterium]|nr:hypothetical protein [Planctomycetota bacterium]
MKVSVHDGLPGWADWHGSGAEKRSRTTAADLSERSEKTSGQENLCFSTLRGIGSSLKSILRSQRRSSGNDWLKDRHPNADIGFSCDWSEKDMRDVTLASLRRFAEEEESE